MFFQLIWWMDPRGATIDVNYKTDDGEGAIASAVKKIKEIIISD